MGRSFSSFLLLFSFLLLLSFTGSVGGSNLIHKVCRKASQNNENLSFHFCVATLQAAPKSQHASFRKLGLISLKLDKTNMTHLNSYIKKLVKHKKFSPYVKEALKDCVELYSNGIDSVKVATKAFKKKDYSTANVHMSAAFDSTYDCEDGFKERKGVVSPLKKENEVLKQLTALVLWFTYVLAVN